MWMPWSGQPAAGALHVSLAYRRGQAGFVPGAPHCAPFQIPPGKGAPDAVSSSVGPGPPAFPAEADLPRLCYCAAALHHLALSQSSAAAVLHVADTGGPW